MNGSQKDQNAIYRKTLPAASANCSLENAQRSRSKKHIIHRRLANTTSAPLPDAHCTHNPPQLYANKATLMRKHTTACNRASDSKYCNYQQKYQQRSLLHGQWRFRATSPYGRACAQRSQCISFLVLEVDSLQDADLPQVQGQILI